MGRATSAALAATWRARLSQWRRSGLSVAEFCRRERISEPSFFGWRKRLTGARTSSGRGSQQSKPADRDGQTRQFVQLPSPIWPVTDGVPVGPASTGVQISLTGGAIITLPTDASAELISVVLRAVVSAQAGDKVPC